MMNDLKSGFGMTSDDISKLKFNLFVLLGFACAWSVLSQLLISSSVLLNLWDDAGATRISIYVVTIIFFTNALLLLPYGTKQATLAAYLKLIVTASLISFLGAFLFLTILSNSKTVYVTYALYALGLFLVNFLLLPYAQLWILKLNPFRYYNELAFISWSNFLQISLFKLTLLLIPISTLVFKVLLADANNIILGVQIILALILLSIVIFATAGRVEIIFKLLSIQFWVMRSLLIASCICLIMICITLLIEFDVYYSDWIVAVWLFFIILTLITAQSRLNRFFISQSITENKGLRLLFISAVFIMALLTLVQIGLIFGTSTLHYLDQFLLIKLIITSLTAIFTLPYAGIFLYAILINPNRLLSKYSSFSNDLSLSTDTLATQQNLVSLRQLLVIRFVEKINIVGSFCIIVVVYTLLYQGGNINRLIADYHIERLLSGETEMRFFDYRLLTVELGDQGKEAYSQILERAKLAGFKDLALLEENLTKHQYQGNAYIYEALEDERKLVEYYQHDVYEGIDIYPPDAVIDIQTMRALRQYMQEYFYLDFCQYHPKFPDNPIESKCTIHKLAINNQDPDRVIYALSNLSANLDDRLLQSTRFVQIDDTGKVTSLESTELADCDGEMINNISNYEDLEAYNKEIMSAFRIIDNPFYSLVVYDAIAQFEDVCPSATQ